MNDILGIFTSLNIAIFFKFALTLLILLYTVFSFILYSHIRSLQRIVIIKESLGHAFVQFFGLIYLLASCVLFLLSLVIL